MIYNSIYRASYTVNDEKRNVVFNVGCNQGDGIATFVMTSAQATDMIKDIGYWLTFNNDVVYISGGNEYTGDELATSTGTLKILYKAYAPTGKKLTPSAPPYLNVEFDNVNRLGFNNEGTTVADLVKNYFDTFNQYVTFIPIDNVEYNNNPNNFGFVYVPIYANFIGKE